MLNELIWKGKIHKPILKLESFFLANKLSFLYKFGHIEVVYYWSLIIIIIVELSKSVYCCVKQHNGRLANYDWLFHEAISIYGILGDPIPWVLIGHWFQCGYDDR